MSVDAEESLVICIPIQECVHHVQMPPEKAFTSEEALQKAINGLEAGIYKSQCQAAEDCSVNQNTLGNHLKGIKPRNIAHASQQLLDAEQVS